MGIIGKFRLRNRIILIYQMSYSLRWVVCLKNNFHHFFQCSVPSATRHGKRSYS